jgi:hypothetical protein
LTEWSAVMAAKTAAAKPAAKPARKGTARTRNGPASPVKSKRASAAVKAGAPAKLSKPTARRATPKPTAKPNAQVVRRDVIDKVVKLRAAGKKWGAIAEETGMTLSALARVRATAKREGVWF